MSQGTEPQGGSPFNGCFPTPTGLPTGLSFTDNGNNTATISGTPTASGQTQVLLVATDCNGASANQALTIDVDKAPRVTSRASAGFQAGAGGTFTVTTNADAYPTPAVSVTGVLPAGVTFTDHGNGTGTLTVAPDAPATSVATPLLVGATSTAGSTSQPFALAIGTAAVITTPATSPSTVTYTTGSPVTDPFAATGTPTPAFTCTVNSTPCGSGNLPAGLSFVDHGDGTAAITGTPSAAGSADVVVTADDGVGGPVSVEETVNVDTSPSFAGTSATSSCAAPDVAATSSTFTVGTNGTWTVCTGGTPAPSIALSSVTCAATGAALPTGLTLTDNGDGSATLSGAAAPGAGLACPAGYTLNLSIANGAGTTTQALTLHVQEAILPTSAPDTPTFVAGASNTYSMVASAVPNASFSVDAGTPLPPWLTLDDHANGTASLTGTPPLADMGTVLNLTVDESNGGFAPTVADPVTVTIAPVGLTAADPPASSVGEPFSYGFAATAPSTFALASGSSLPPGLTLSPSGVLSGTPTAIGRWPVSIAITTGTGTVDTSTINVIVNAGHHALEITEFRSFGPGGNNDWYVKVLNTTTATIPLTGWNLDYDQPCATCGTVTTPLGTGSLPPGGTEIVSGPSYSLGARQTPGVTGSNLVGLPGGFEIIAPDKTVTDVAGEAGAPAGLVAGGGASFPSTVNSSAQYAFAARRLGLGPADGHRQQRHRLLVRERGARLLEDRPQRQSRPGHDRGPGEARRVHHQRGPDARLRDGGLLCRWHDAGGLRSRPRAAGLRDVLDLVHHARDEDRPGDLQRNPGLRALDVGGRTGQRQGGGGRLLARGGGRRGLHLRGCGIPRLDGWRHPQPADREHQLDPRRRRLLAGRLRRGDLRLR